MERKMESESEGKVGVYALRIDGMGLDASGGRAWKRAYAYAYRLCQALMKLLDVDGELHGVAR